MEIEVSVGGRERPANILVDRWTRGSPVAVDPTVTHPIAPGQGLSLEAATKAVVTKAQSKIAKYSDLDSTHKLEFVPFFRGENHRKRESRKLLITLNDTILQAYSE